MKIGVLSDSHGNKFSLGRAIKALGQCDIIYHLGDYASDCKIIKENLDIPVITIRGNCDNKDEGILEIVQKIESVNIFLTHGHNYGVNFNIFKLRFKALETDSKIVLYGHTHVGRIDLEEDIYFINPGSISEPRDGSKPSVAIIEINNRIIIPKLIHI